MVREGSNDSENNDHRRPRPYGHSEGSDREDLFEEDDDEDDLDEDDEEDSDDEGIQIQPDRVLEARMVADQQLAQMAQRTREIQEAVAERQRELNQIRAAREQREREAQEAKANETKTAEKDYQQKDDRDKDHGGNSST